MRPWRSRISDIASPSYIRQRGLRGGLSGREEWNGLRDDRKSQLGVLTYDIDTTPGQSGSPVTVQIPCDQANQVHQVGVHVGTSGSKNVATAFTEDALAWMTEAAGELGLAMRDEVREDELEVVERELIAATLGSAHT